MSPRGRHIRETLRVLIRQGIAPRQLALAVAAGMVLGNIPVFGVSTLLCTALAMALRLNLAAIQAAQAAMGPAQFLLFVPFVRLGEWLLGAPRQAVSVAGTRALMSQGAGHAVAVLGGAIVHAGIAWLAVAAPAVYVLQKLLEPVFERATARIAPRAARATAQFHQRVNP